MKKGLKKAGITLCALLFIFVFAVRAFAVPVEVLNFTVLMDMIQQRLAGAITQRIADVWNDEIKRFKLAAGLLDVDGVQVALKDTSGVTTTQTFEKLWSVRYGAWAQTDGQAWKDAINKDTIKLPSAPADPDSIYAAALIAGPAEKHDRNVMSDTQLATAQMSDLKKQADIQGLELALQNRQAAERAKDELAKIKPSSWDPRYPEVAIKDQAKISYLNALMEADSLQMQASDQMRKTLNWADRH